MIARPAGENQRGTVKHAKPGGGGYVYKAFSHDVTAAILVFQGNETAAMLVCQENPVGVELFSHVNALLSQRRTSFKRLAISRSLLSF